MYRTPSVMGSAHVNRMCGYVGDVLAMLALAKVAHLHSKWSIYMDHLPYQHRCSLTLLAQYLDEHDRGKLFLFQKYAQDALVRRKQHPPQL